MLEVCVLYLVYWNSYAFVLLSPLTPPLGEGTRDLARFLPFSRPISLADALPPVPSSLQVRLPLAPVPIMWNGWGRGGGRRRRGGGCRRGEGRVPVVVAAVGPRVLGEQVELVKEKEKQRWQVRRVSGARKTGIDSAGEAVGERKGEKGRHWRGGWGGESL